MFKNFGIILKIDRPHVKIYDCTSANPTAHTAHTAFQQLTQLTQLTQPFSSLHSSHSSHSSHSLSVAYTAFK